MRESNGNGPLAEAVTGTLDDAARKAAQQQAIREAQARAFHIQQRLSIGAAVLSGMCAGFYSTDPSTWTKGFGDTLVMRALEFADQLMAQVMKPPAANDG